MSEKNNKKKKIFAVYIIKFVAKWKKKKKQKKKTKTKNKIQQNETKQNKKKKRNLIALLQIGCFTKQIFILNHKPFSNHCINGEYLSHRLNIM